MVHFGDKLKTNMVRRWAEHYLDYKRLKQAIRRREDREASDSGGDDAVLAARLAEYLERVAAGGSLGSPSPTGEPAADEGHKVARQDSSASLEVSLLSEGSMEELESITEGDAEGAFVSLLLRQIRKVEDFYSERCAEYARRLELLAEQAARHHARVSHLGATAGDDSDDDDPAVPRAASAVTPSPARWGSSALLDPDTPQGTVEIAAARSPPPSRPLRAQRSFSSYSVVSTGSPQSTATLLRRQGSAAAEESGAFGGTYEDAERAARSAQSLRRAFLDLYRSMQLLQNYTVLNYTGFVKIMKKHDKNTQVPLSEPATAVLHSCSFSTAEALRSLISEVEQTFADAFADGDVGIARGMLLVKQRAGPNWRQLDLGLRLGLGIMLLFWMAWDCVVDSRLRPSSDYAAVMPIYRCMGCLVLMMWCWGVSLYVWSTARINYLYMFELSPTRTMTYDQALHKAGVLSAAFCANFLLFFKTVRSEIPLLGGTSPGWIPLVMALFLFVQFLCPWRREVMWGIRNCVIAPFGIVTFYVSYIGDVFTSLAKVFTDIAYSACFFASGDFLDHAGRTTCQHSPWFVQVAKPLLCALPLWFRMHQNFRRYHDTGKRFPSLANAFKYAFAHSVVLFGVFHPAVKSTDHHVTAYQALWIFSLAVSTLYTYSWDVTMDWGLGRPQYNGLRKRLMYRRVWVYYAAICADLVLRFLWTLTLLPSRAGVLLLADYLDPFLAAAEICRRTMWGLFRLENEHLSNTEGYRRVDFVPLHFETATAGGNEQRPPSTTARSVVLEIAGMTTVVVGLGLVAVLSAR